MPCYNYAQYLPECLRGIFGQEGYDDFEIVAVDDGSTDNTQEVLRAFADSRLHVIVHERNRGHVETVNRGLRETRGKYVVRVDPDDRHRPWFLKETVPILESHSEVGLVYGNVSLINEKGQVTVECGGADLGDQDHKGNELIEILQKNYICAPTVIARREAWMSAWPVPDGLAFNDWYFNVMLARRWEYYYVHKVLADYRVHAANHHVRIIVNKTEEASILRVLDKVYSEPEADLALEKAKQRVRRRVYASQYLDLAEKYFGTHLNADARRCYWQAIRRQPQILLWAGVARRFTATLVGRNAYELGKRFLVDGVTELTGCQRTVVVSSKAFVRNRFPGVYANLRRVYRLPYDYWKPRPGNIGSILEEFCIRTARPLSFVQIGANNGNDEFTLLRQRYGWKGIMVEPQKKVFVELVSLNQGNGIIFEPVAITDQECERILYKISFSSADWATTLASFDKKVIEQSISNGWVARCSAQECVALPTRVQDYFSVEKVRCTTLKKLIDKHSVKSLDILILDTEGHDFEIIRQIKDLEFRPRAIVFEHKYFSFPDFKKCVRVLRDWRYLLHADDSNTIGLLNECTSPQKV